ncbi:hypothetical protein OIE48_15380 [Streptosporangium sp. NBC_01756]|nr:hypothetical protein [Streptosporangium sp. NBC_01756]WSC89503.1 hypothetical protein OIE48_15380 [Streptosporangium sp. NBC_01756]
MPSLNTDPAFTITWNTAQQSVVNLSILRHLAHYRIHRHRWMAATPTGAVGPGGAGEAAVDVDPVCLDVEGAQLLGLHDDVLLVGGAAGVADPSLAVRGR